MNHTPLSTVRVTMIGGPTALLEIGGLRVLTDPVFGPAGSGSAHSRKTADPAIAAAAIGPIDVILLSHDEHPDNLDATGRALLPTAKTVLTTMAGAQRLGGNAVGLAPWQTFDLTAPDGTHVTIIGTPARHGPDGIEARLGEVTGFALSWNDQAHGALYLSGDTVWYEGVAAIGEHVRVGTAFLFLGAVQIEAYGSSRLTMNAAEAAVAARALGARTIIPIHWEGWSHYRETQSEIQEVFTADGLGAQVRWLVPGVAVDLSV